MASTLYAGHAVARSRGNRGARLVLAALLGHHSLNFGVYSSQAIARAVHHSGQGRFRQRPCQAQGSQRTHRLREQAAIRQETPSWKVDEFGEVDPTPWKGDSRVTAYVNELRNIQPLKVGDAGAEDILLAEKVGMLVYPLKTYVHVRDSNNTWLFVWT